jgi:hypothetical protein
MWGIGMNGKEVIMLPIINVKYEFNNMEKEYFCDEYRRKKIETNY